MSGSVLQREQPARVAPSGRDAPDPRITALVIAHDARASGGVNNFLRVMRTRYRGRVAALRFANGRREGEKGKLRSGQRLLRDYFRFAGLLLRRRFDVLHVNPSLDSSSTPRELLFVWLCSLLRPSTRILVFYRGWNWSTVDALRQSSFKRRLFLATHRRVDRVLVLAGAFKGALVSLGVPAERIFTVSTMFEGGVLERVVADTPADRRQILFLCRFIPAKGGVELLHAFARVRDRFPDWTLVMAGDGPQRAKLEALTDELALRDRVTYTGYIGGARKMRLLVESGIFALPTAHPEGMPNAILEAMAAGEVILTTAIGGIPDIVDDGIGGTIMPVPDVDTIEAALLRYMGDPALIEAAGRHNKERAWARYESAIVSDRIAGHYAALATAPR